MEEEEDFEDRPRPFKIVEGQPKPIKIVNEKSKSFKIIMDEKLKPFEISENRPFKIIDGKSYNFKRLVSKTSEKRPDIVTVQNPTVPTKVLLNCIRCPYQTYNCVNFQEHLTANHSFNCKLCSFACSTKLTLLQHEKQVHLPKNSKTATTSTATGKAIYYHSCPFENCTVRCLNGKDLAIHKEIAHPAHTLNFVPHAQHKIIKKMLPMRIQTNDLESTELVVKPKPFEEITLVPFTSTSDDLMNGKESDIKMEMEENEEAVAADNNDDELIQCVLPEIKEEDENLIEAIVFKDITTIMSDTQFVATKQEKVVDNCEKMNCEKGTAKLENESEEEAEKDNPQPEPRVKCLDCNEVMTLTELLWHRELEHSMPEIDFDNIHMAPVPTNFPERRPLNKIRIDEQMQIVVCDICFKEMPECKLDAHRENSHGEKKLLCHICSKTFATHSNLSNHLNTHDPKSQYCCDLCGHCFARKHPLRMHIRRTHCNIYKVRDTCSICNQKMYKRGVIEKHMAKYHPNGLDEGYRVNSETNYFDCERCGGNINN